MSGRHPTRRDGKRGASLLRRWLPVLAVLGAVFVLAAAVYIPVRLTSTTSYCTSCHEMKAAGTSLARSAHRNVDCLSCHVDPGVGNAVRWRLAESKNIWASYLNMPMTSAGMSPQIHAPSEAACTRSGCHDLSTLGTTFGNVKMDHAKHVEMRGLTCIDCHTGVGHPEQGSGTAVSMSSCFMCHNGAAAPNQCSLCHVETPAGASHPADYIKVHGRFALLNEQECLRCHHDKAAFCDACHAKPTPAHYSGTWRYTHGAAAKADRAGCLGCHSYETFCIQCHQVDHPSDWATTHGQAATAAPKSCLVCHPRSMCVQCHEQRGVSAP
jgi:nitrate/TMAO reductase-like tetraheme cytochrome c subunit